MSDNWYYMLGGKETGPVTLGELQFLIASGTLKPTDEVRRQGTPGLIGRWS